MATITFDNGATGATLTTVGDTPIYHDRTHVTRGAPTVDTLSAYYAAAGGNVLVHPATLWDDGTTVWDIIPMRNSSSLELDIWFGDPSTTGTRVTIDIDGTGTYDLLASDPISGYTFQPDRVYVVGQRLYAWCSVYTVSTTRRSKMALLSAAMTDIRDEVADPWTVHAVTNEVSTLADGAGQFWSMSHVQAFEGKLWTIGVDYLSVVGATSKAGGQYWTIGYETDGTFIDCVRMHTRVQANTHSHGGCILYDGADYYAMCHYGDDQPRLYRRRADSLLTFADNATVDTSSGIGGLYRTKDASLTDWDAVALSAGADEATAASVNLNWANALILTVDPLDNSKFIYGSDTGAGMISRVELDSNGIAVSTPIFNPVSRSRANIDTTTATQHLLLLLLDKSGQYLAGIISNVIDDGSSKDEYTGVAYSDDYGVTWSIVWRGSPTAGIPANAGIAVLQSGKVIVGKVADTTSSVRCITPGAKISGRPLFVGYRPTNIIGNASDQRVLVDEAGGVVSVGTTPEKALPSYLHNTESFSLRRAIPTQAGTIEIVNLGLDQTAFNAGNLWVIWWERKLTPAGTTENDRVAIRNQYQLTIPGASLGSSPVERARPSETISEEWHREMLLYKPTISHTFTANPSDLRIFLRGEGGVATTCNAEWFPEAVCVAADRPGLPYPTRTEAGVASGKFSGLALGEAWTIIVALQIPEECWDSWTGPNLTTGQWAAAAPVLTITDSTSTNGITLQGKMDAIALDGLTTGMATADFNWGIFDSSLATVTEIPDYPMRCTSVVVAISKDGTGDIQYAIGTPAGVVSGTRAMATAISADILRFCDIDETDSLEMYVHQAKTSRTAYNASQLETMVNTMAFPVLTTNRSRDRSRER